MTWSAILSPSENVLTVPRRLRPEVADAMERVARGPAFKRREQVDAEHPNTDRLLEPIHDRSARDFLATDVTALIGAFGRLLNRRHLHATLAVVHDDACRKLHADYVTVRLLCTYAGPGTQWLSEADSQRKNLGRIDVDVDTANRSVVRPGGVLRSCDIGEVILLKGNAFSGNTGRGAIHRSPPIHSLGIGRLVFKLDEHPCGC